jgi:hypothetical protein
MTARGLFLKMGTAPSHTAHAEIPLCQYVSSPGRLSRRADAPVAMMTVSAVSGGDCSSPSRQYLKGRSERSAHAISTGRRDCSEGRLTDLGNRLRVDDRPKSNGLGTEEIHHLGSTDTVGESGAKWEDAQVSMLIRDSSRNKMTGGNAQVLNVGGGRELSSSGEAVGEHTLGRRDARVSKR